VLLDKMERSHTEYMRKRRSEEVFRTKERSRDAAAKRKTRQLEPQRQFKRDMNSSRMRVTRQLTAYRQLEQVKNSSRMRVTRQLTAYRQLEQVKNSSRMKVTRQVTAYRVLEQIKNSSRMRAWRQDPLKQETERAQNASRMKVTRKVVANRTLERIKNLSRMRVARQKVTNRLVERSKNVSRMRATRTNIAKRQLEQVKNTIKRKEIRKLPERKETERKQRCQRVEAIKKDLAQKKARARRSNVFRKRESEARKKYRKRLQEETLETKLKKFREKSKEGPTCICTCCGSLWFRSSVHSVSKANLVNKHNSEFLEKIFHLSTGDTWICRTCYIYVLKGQVPKLALSNGLDFPHIPDVLKNLTTLEERLVALRLPFLQIRSLGVDRQCGIKGNVVHISNDIDTSVSCIPRTADQASIIPVVLVRQLDHQKPYLFQMVRPLKIYKAAKYLLTTPVYQAEGATLSPDWLKEANNLKSKEENSDKSSEKVENISEDDRLKNDQMETMIMQYGSDAIKIAPGQGKQPMSLLMDIVADEASYPTIYGGQRRSIPPNVTFHEIWKSECRRYDRR